jgi:xanthine dehydrogenase small subunit
MDRIRFYVNDRLVEESAVPPTATLLNYLRDRLGLTGTKEGCAEGDCGACTVAILDPRPAAPEGASVQPTFRAVNACLLFLPMVQGKRIYTVEALRDGALHPVQEALSRALGSQCGYCTPGIVMSMFEACYRDDLQEAWQVDDQMCGNLCRCTGYRPIRDAAHAIAGRRPAGRFAKSLENAVQEPAELDYLLETPDGTWRYFNPSTFPALFALRERHPEARLVAGGTDLGIEVSKYFRTLPTVISVEGIPELRRISREATHWSFGAAATLTEIQEATRGGIPVLEKMLRVFASRQIRNRATIGGNLCTASPVGDLAPVLLALGARAVLCGPGGARSLPIDQFFVGYRRTALAPDEVLAAVLVPDLPKGARAASYKVSKRRELDISTVAAGCYVRLDSAGRVAEARFGYGGMAALPRRARAVEDALVGRPWNEASVRAVMPLLETDFRPISDLRGSAWYRSLVAKNLLLGFYLETREHLVPALCPRPTSTVHLETAR